MQAGAGGAVEVGCTGRRHHAHTVLIDILIPDSKHSSISTSKSCCKHYNIRVFILGFRTCNDMQSLDKETKVEFESCTVHDGFSLHLCDSIYYDRIWLGFQPL